MKVKVIISLLPLFFLLLFFYYPLFSVLRDAFLVEDTFTISNFIRILSSPLEQRVILFTFYQAILSTYLTLVLGLPAAYLFGKYDFPGKEIIRSLITIPFVLPSIVVALGFIILFGENGILPRIFSTITGIDISLDGLTLILLAHAYYNAPIVIQMVSSSMERMDPYLEEAAESLGDSGIHKFMYIFFPQIFPALVSSALLTFIFCFMSFTIVITLGGPQYRTIEVHLFSLYKVLFRKGEAAALAVLQLITSLTFSYIYIKSTESITKIERLGRVERARVEKIFSNIRDLIDIKKLFLVIYFIFLLAFFMFPIMSVVFSSFYDRVTNNFTLDGYLTLLSSVYSPYLGTSPQRAIYNSLLYAVATMIGATLLGLLASYSTSRIKIPFRSLYSALIIVPLGVSTITLSLGLVRSYLVSDFFYENIWILILVAHILVGFPFTMRAISNALERVDPDLIDAGRMLGADDIHTFMKIDLPIIAPGIIVGGIFAFAISIGEMAATLFLASPDYITIPVAMYSFISVRKYVVASAMGTILILITFISFLVIRLFGEKQIAGGF